MLAGFSLIVAIGAQNAFVLRQGTRREHVGLVVAICVASDMLLIALGTLGIGALITANPALLVVLKWAGAAYLIWFGVQSLRSARHPGSLDTVEPRSPGSVALTALAITYLNPHVYLDTVVLLGSLAHQAGPGLAWVFAGGAMVASSLWFTALGFGARALAPLFAKPRTWQILDVFIAVVMFALAASLLWPR